jgi:hypothetical protein
MLRDGAPEILTREEVAEVQLGCMMLYHRLGVAADLAFEGFANCFARQAVWIRPSMEMVGQDQIRAFVESEKVRAASHLTRHMYSTISIDAIDRDHATGVAYAVIYRREDWPADRPAPMALPELLASYRSEFVFEGGSWKFSRHEATHTFAQYATS